MYIDAHFHIDDLSEYVTDIPALLAQMQIQGTASCHSLESFSLAKKIKDLLHRDYSREDQCNQQYLHTETPSMHTPSLTLSYGIHPQAVDMNQLEVIADFAQRRLINTIGECGFDFYGDRPSCILTDENLLIQKKAFQAQLVLAKQFLLPVIIHARKAQPLIFEEARTLAELPAVIFHSWNGSAQEARDLLKHIPNAYFSFGTSLLNGNKKTFSSAGTVPLHHMLTESDAPWQAPRNEPLPGAKAVRAYSSPEDIPRILLFIAFARISHGEFVQGFWRNNPDTNVLEEITQSVFDNYSRIYTNEHV